MLTLYAKNVVENIPANVLRQIRKRLMTKAKRNIGLEILEGIREIKRGEHGRVITVPPVSAVRESTGLSQSQFAELIGVSVGAVWVRKKGRRERSGEASRMMR